MKTAGRVLIGLLGTATLTIVILFAIDAYRSHLKAVQLAVLLETGYSDENEKNGAENNSTPVSIASREHQIVNQIRENTGSDGIYYEQHNLTDQDSGSVKKSSDTQQGGQAGSSKSEPTRQTDTQPGRTSSQTDKQKPAQTDSKSAGQTKSDSAEQKKSADKDTDKQSQESSRSDTFKNVTQDYFSDAVFIGDSRTVGMQQSNLLPNATYYAKTGIGIGSILTKRIVYESGTMISVKEALSRHSFKKVYIMIGINDISAGDLDWFTEQYTEILDTVRKTQPEAVIYIQGNIPMSYRTQDMNGSLNNKNLSLRNEASQKLADSKNIFYLDIDELYADANGNLASMYTKDGLHVDTSHYPIWVDYLLHHAIER